MENLAMCLDILQCVDCSGSLQTTSSGVICQDCGRLFELKGQILDVEPQTGHLPTPPIYDDPDYVKLQAFSRRMTEFTYSDRTALALHNPGHRTVEQLSQTRPSITVDVGCGHAYHRVFMRDGSFYIGLDSDMKSLTASLRNIPQDSVLLLLGYAEKLPFRSGSIEKLVSIYTLEHLFYLDEVLREVGRVLRPDGEFLISIPTEGSLLWSLGRRVLMAWRFRDLDFDYFKAIKIEHCNSARAILAALKRYFHIDKIRYFPFRVPMIDLNLLVSLRATPLGVEG